MEIDAEQYTTMVAHYHALKESLPPHLQEQLPTTLGKFLSPANIINWRFNYNGTEELSITGTKRWQMLQSPHALTLLKAYAVQRL